MTTKTSRGPRLRPPWAGVLIPGARQWITIDPPLRDDEELVLVSLQGVVANATSPRAVEVYNGSGLTVAYTLWAGPRTVVRAAQFPWTRFVDALRRPGGWQRLGKTLLERYKRLT